MSYSPAIIEQAKKLRSEGATYVQIAAKLQLSIPKATLAYWCRGITLLPETIQARRSAQIIHLSAARKLSVEQKRIASAQRFQAYAIRAHNIVKKLQTREAHLLALAMLYLGEGAKATGHSGLLLGSSDPGIVKLYIGLLEKCYGIAVDDLRCRISYRADQNIDELETYWSEITRIPRNHFYKTSPDRRTLGKPTRKLDYRGVCVISCRGRDRQLELQQISVEFLELLTGL